MHFSGGMASCAACMLAPLPHLIDEGFGHDGAAGISCAEDQDPIWFTWHSRDEALWCSFLRLGPGPWVKRLE
jgi:hypothetical protein